MTTPKERPSTTTTEESFHFPVTVPAGKSIRATALLYEGNIDTPYTAEMKYTLDSGKEFQYSVSGTYHGVAMDKVKVTIEEA